MRRQFGRLPFLSQEGESYYLHLAVWRANARLSNKQIWLYLALLVPDPDPVVDQRTPSREWYLQQQDPSLQRKRLELSSWKKGLIGSWRTGV